jgi:PhnB protein
MAKPIPDGYHTLTPILVFNDCRKAIAFYKKAFGAVEQYVMDRPDGTGVMHAAIKIGDSIIMLCDEHAECPHKSVETIGASPISMFLYVKNVDTAFEQAVTAGGEPQMPVQEMFWGDRAGSITDPFGFCWMLATHVKDRTHDEIRLGAEEACAAGHGAGKSR